MGIHLPEYFVSKFVIYFVLGMVNCVFSFVGLGQCLYIFLILCFLCFCSSFYVFLIISLVLLAFIFGLLSKARQLIAYNPLSSPILSPPYCSVKESWKDPKQIKVSFIVLFIFVLFKSQFVLPCIFSSLCLLIASQFGF